MLVFQLDRRFTVSLQLKLSKLKNLMPNPEISSNIAVTSNLYETDFHAWTQAQVALLRERRWTDLDAEFTTSIASSSLAILIPIPY